MLKTKCLWKSEVKFIRCHLQELDLAIMEAFVVEEVETVEFLKSTLCELFSGHSTPGAECFVRLLATWYQRIGALACAAMSTQSCSELWRALTCDFNGAVSVIDKSALVSDVFKGCCLEQYLC